MGIERRHEGAPVVIAFEHRTAGALQAHDAWWTVEGAEHQRDPAVLTEVGDGFGTRAGEVQIRNRPVVEDPQGVESLRRDVDMSVNCQRCRCDEEEVLTLDPLPDGWGHAFMNGGHDPTVAGPRQLANAPGVVIPLPLSIRFQYMNGSPYFLRYQ